MRNNNYGGHLIMNINYGGHLLMNIAAEIRNKILIKFSNV